MNPSKNYGLHKNETPGLKKYEQIFNLEHFQKGEKSTKAKKPRKTTTASINSEFLDKVMQIKNNKLSPTLQISSDRSHHEISRSNLNSATFYTQASNTSAYFNPSRSPTGIYITPTYTKATTFRDGSPLISKPYMTSIDMAQTMTMDNNNSVSFISPRKRHDLTSPASYDVQATRSLPSISKSNTNQSLMNLPEIYENIGELSNGIRNIVEQRYDEKISSNMATDNWRQVIDIQRSRLHNIFAILDRKGVDKYTEVSMRIQDDLTRLVKHEITKISQVYEQSIMHFFEKSSQSKPAKEKIVKVEMDLYSALRALVEYSNYHRVEGLTREGFDKLQKMQDIVDEINEFKIRVKLKKHYDHKVLEVFEELEALVKDMNATIERQKFNYEKLVEENTRLIDNSKSEITKFREDNLDLIKRHFEHRKTEPGPQDLPIPVFKEKHFQMKINDVENRLKDAIERIKIYEDKYKKAKSELALLQRNPDSALKKTHDVAVGVNLYSEKREGIKLLRLSDYLKASTITNGAAQTAQWVTYSISLIYSDKLISDMIDDYEKRPRKLMKDYVIQWFMKRYGLYSISETLIKDFIYNLRESYADNDRYQLFCMMIGVDEPKEDKRQEVQLRKTFDELESNAIFLKRMKHAYYQSIETQKLYLRMCWMIKQHALSSYVHGPFLPNFFVEGGDLISVDVARQIMHQVTTEERFEPERVKMLEDKFNDKLVTDLYHRVVEEKGETYGGAAREKNEGDHKFVRFDFIMRFIMEQLIENRVKDLSQFVTVMKLNQLNKGDTNLSIEEFQNCCVAAFSRPDEVKSQAWQEHAFTTLMDEPNADKIPFEKLVQRLIPPFTNQSYAKDFYIKVAHEKNHWYSKDKDKDKKGVTHSQPKEAKQISLELSSRYNTVFQSKTTVTLGPPALAHSVVTFYDTISSMMVLLESYDIFKERVESVQQSIEQLEFIHEELKEDLARLPQGLNVLTKYELLQQYNQHDLVLYIEGCWKKLRTMLGICFRPSSNAY